VQSRGADRRSAHIRSVLPEERHLGAREQVAQLPGDFRLEHVRQRHDRAGRERSCNRRLDFRVRVPQQGSAARHHEVDPLTSVGIADTTAGGVLDEGRVPTPGPAASDAVSWQPHAPIRSPGDGLDVGERAGFRLFGANLNDQRRDTLLVKPRDVLFEERDCHRPRAAFGVERAREQDSDEDVFTRRDIVRNARGAMQRSAKVDGQLDGSSLWVVRRPESRPTVFGADVELPALALAERRRQVVLVPRDAVRGRSDSRSRRDAGWSRRPRREMSYEIANKNGITPISSR